MIVVKIILRISHSRRLADMVIRDNTGHWRRWLEKAKKAAYISCKGSRMGRTEAVFSLYSTTRKRCAYGIRGFGHIHCTASCGVMRGRWSRSMGIGRIFSRRLNHRAQPFDLRESAFLRYSPYDVDERCRGVYRVVGFQIVGEQKYFNEQ
jgi:hypothetical protein